MPGSPPISTTEPSTNPPPSTRSSSPEAVEKRGTSSTLTSARVFSCACWPAQPPRAAGAAPPDSIMVSVRVFQAPHSPHCPAHLGKVAPHSVQPYMRLALAMKVSCSSVVAHDSEPGADRAAQRCVSFPVARDGYGREAEQHRRSADRGRTEHLGGTPSPGCRAQSPLQPMQPKDLS